MNTTTSLRTLDIARAEARVAAGGAYIDLREVHDYLDLHVPGSLSLEYEFGPGLPGRARDCIPLHVPFVLLERGDLDMSQVAASFRGKGFAVSGVLEGGVDAWAEARGDPASSDIYEGDAPPAGTVLDIGDPGVRIIAEARFISIERLWKHAGDLAGEKELVVAAGRGLRAALAVGMLERNGVRDPVFWWTRGRQTGTRMSPAGIVKR